MKTLQDLLARRDEFVHGVIEIHGKNGHALRSKILWINISGDEIEFTVEKTVIAKGSNWELVTEPHPRNSICYSTETKTTEGFRPQFEIPNGWAILYPNTDSVRIP